MKLFIDNTHFIDTSKGIDISLPLSNDEHNPKAWYVDAPIFEPVRANGFVGSVSEGGAVNFRNIFFNPHGHGTHTECVGHITEKIHSINQVNIDPFMTCELISVTPKKIKDDFIIDASCFEDNFIHSTSKALIIRTFPNQINKKSSCYSGKNPPFLALDVLPLLVQKKIDHLLIDLPSVDKEVDGGELAFHHAFWGLPNNIQMNKTITELVYIQNEIKDGHYLLNLQTAPFENDATPCRPILFKIEQI